MMNQIYYNENFLINKINIFIIINLLIYTIYYKITVKELLNIDTLF